MKEAEKTYTIREIARETRLSEYFLRRKIKDGTIPVIMCGNRAKLTISMLMDAIEPQSAKQITRRNFSVFPQSYGRRATS